MQNQDFLERYIVVGDYCTTVLGLPGVAAKGDKAEYIDAVWTRLVSSLQGYLEVPQNKAHLEVILKYSKIYIEKNIILHFA